MSSGGAPASRGYITMATGRQHFLELAVDMALSLREHTTLPVALACDEALAGTARSAFAAVFDEVRLVPDRFLRGRVRKYGVAEATPFSETTFVDADCIVLGPLDHLFDALREHEMAMVGEQLTLEDDEDHHGFSSRKLMRRFGLERYLKTNSGIFTFRREPGIEIMEECRRCFLEEARPKLRWSPFGWLGDEIGFGIVGGRRGLGSLPLPAPMYWPVEFDTIDLSAPKKPLLHLIWPPSEEVTRALMDGIRTRREEAGLPGDSEPIWREEIRELERMRRRLRMLDRLGLR